MKKNLFLIFFCLSALFLSSCADKNAQNGDGTVQDIQPGDQSVIQAPASQSPESNSRIQERNI